MNLYITRTNRACFLLIALFLVYAVFGPLLEANAQTQTVEIAKMYEINDTVSVESGDIISFQPDSQNLVLSRSRSDKNIFGISVENPLLVLSTEEGGTPIVRTGEVIVNVTDNGGAIVPGDFITSSSIPGKGEKALETDQYIVGVALGSFPEDGVVAESGEVIVGQIPVLLSIGTRQNAITELKLDQMPTQNTGVTEATVLNIIQYLLAAFIAVGSIFISFKNYGPSIREGIASIGRNPLAKPTIQSMVVLNTIIIVLISGGGLLVAIAILLLPI